MGMDPLATATAGLRATQAAIGIVSQNVANAGTAGYVRRTTSTVASGIGNSGVAVGTITRSFDAAALKQLRLETGGSAYTATRADILTQLDRLYGTPGSSTALDGVLNTFTQSLQTLSANPTSVAARTGVVESAAALANRIGGIASGVQDLRGGIESRIATETADASTLLAGIASLNVKIQNTSPGAARADLLDARDQKLNQLSAYLDIQTVEQRDGTMTVVTNSGVTLVDRGQAASLRFDARTALGANSSYDSDPQKSGVGHIVATTPGGARIDLTEPGLLRAGSLAAQLELRDAILPQAQRQLDDLAAGLATALTDTTVTGTAAGAGFGIDPSKLQPGNRLTVPVAGPGGVVRNVILIASDGATQGIDAAQSADGSAFVQTFKIPTGAETYAGNVQAALDAMSTRLQGEGYPPASLPTLTAGAAGTTLTLTGTGGFSVKGLSANVTVPTSASDLSTGFPQIALFVDGAGKKLVTGSFDAGSQLTGLAQRLAVNPAVTGKTAALVATSGTDATASSVRAQFVFDTLTTAQQTFSSSSGIGGVAAPYRTSVADFAQDIIAAQGSNTANAQSLDQGQSIALATAQARFSESAGVSIDEEMSSLIALQTAYGANARVLTAARDMLDALLRI